MSRPVGPVKLLPIINGHLPLVVERLARVCAVCRGAIGEGEPMCERCGLRAFHYRCYKTKIARERLERQWWESELAEADDLYLIIVCPGCRS